MTDVGRCEDPTCPCRDGLSCHYEDAGDTKAMPRPKLHGRDCPARCSMCAELRGEQIEVHRISQSDGLIRIDGVPTRPVNAETSSAAAYYGKRGKAASSRVTRSKKT